MLKETFSNNLIKYRKLKGLSQSDLAKKIKQTPRAISYYENGMRNEFLEKLEIIAKALDVSPLNLLSKDDKKPIKINSFFEKIDTVTLKKLKLFLELNPNERSMIYKMIEGILEKKSKSKQSADSKK